jgi:hypothetical protein
MLFASSSSINLAHPITPNPNYSLLLSLAAAINNTTTTTTARPPILPFSPKTPKTLDKLHVTIKVMLSLLPPSNPTQKIKNKALPFSSSSSYSPIPSPCSLLPVLVLLLIHLSLTNKSIKKQK